MDLDSFVKNSIEYFQLTIPTRLAFRKTGKDAIQKLCHGAEIKTIEQPSLYYSIVQCIKSRKIAL